MDKNEAYELLQKVVGTTRAIEKKIKESETLTMADYLDLELALDNMKADLEKARTIQYSI